MTSPARFPESVAVWACPAAEMIQPPDTTRPDWLAARALGIGGSDIAAIVGLSRWATAYGVWDNKTTGRELDDNDAMDWGRRLEPILADHFTDTTGIPTIRVGLMRNRAHPLAIGSVDRLTDCTGHCPQVDGIWEGKTTSWRMADEWDDEQIPDAAELQAQWYLGVTGRSHAHVSVLIDGRNPLQRTVQADRALFEVLVKQAEEFWHLHVETNTPPPITSGLALDEVKRRYPDAEPVVKVADPDQLEPLLAALEVAGDDYRTAKDRRDALTARVRDLIGEATELWSAGRLRATCKTQTRKSYIASESTFRRLVIKKES